MDFQSQKEKEVLQSLSAPSTASNESTVNKRQRADALRHISSEDF